MWEGFQTMSRRTRDLGPTGVPAQAFHCGCTRLSTATHSSNGRCIASRSAVDRYTTAHTRATSWPAVHMKGSNKGPKEGDAIDVSPYRLDHQLFCSRSTCPRAQIVWKIFHSTMPSSKSLPIRQRIVKWLVIKFKDFGAQPKAVLMARGRLHGLMAHLRARHNHLHPQLL
jgi:hypothetical protein